MISRAGTSLLCAALVVTAILVLPHSSSVAAFMEPSHRARGVFSLSSSFGIGRSGGYSTKKTESSKCSRVLSTTTTLQMGLDLATYLRTEWVSASICTNQIPRECKSVLQLGTEDGRAVNFVPRTVEELITSTAEPERELSIGSRRQLKQQRDRRGSGVTITYSDQCADDLTDTKDGSVDVVISLQAADKMRENGMDWKRSVREAARVLKPGGRFLFVEKTDIEGDNYLNEVMGLVSLDDNSDNKGNVVSKKEGAEGEEEEETYPVFEMIGYDDVDLVIVPHIAGVVMKAEYAGLTAQGIEAKKEADKKAQIAELSISAFERGLKKRKKKKKKSAKTADANSETIEKN